jgi:hypothetical protein
MKRVLTTSAALVLSVTASAWAAVGPQYSVEPYPASFLVEKASPRTRPEVLAELHEAQRLGLMSGVEGDFFNVKVGQEAGDAAVGWADAGAIRVKVRAEALEAARLGMLSVGEENPPIATAEQEKMITAAGRRAVDGIVSTQTAVRAPATR